MAGEGKYSKEESIQVRVLPPTNLTVSYNPEKISVVLQWAQVKGCMGYVVKRSTDKPNSTFTSIKTINDPLVTQFEDTNFMFGIEHSYVVVSLDFIGESSNSDKKSIYLRAPAPKNVVATLQSQSNNIILVRWTPIPHSIGYIVKRATESSTPSFSTIGTIPNPQAESFSDFSFKFGVQYYYVVVSIDKTGESEQSNPYSIIHRTPMPTNFTAIYDSTDHYTRLQWNPISNCKGYIIKRETTSLSNSFEIIIQIDHPSIGQTKDADIILGLKYRYVISAIDEIGDNVASEPVIVECPRASAPIGLIASFDEIEKCIVIQWIPVRNCKGYILKRLTNMSNTGYLAGVWNVFKTKEDNQLITIAELDNFSVNKIRDTSFIYGVKYSYKLSVVDAIGDDNSTVLTDTVFRAPVPKDFCASFAENGGNRIILQWTPVNNTTGYVIRRSTKLESSSFTEIKRVNDPTVGLIEDYAKLVSDTTYYYTIASIDVIGESDQSNPTSVMCSQTAALQDFTASYNENKHSIVLQWKLVENVQGYILKRGKNSSKNPFVVLNTMNTPETTEFADTTFTYGINYCYTINSIDKNNKSNLLTSVNICVRAPTPKNIRASFKKTDKKEFISIQWDPVPNVTKYVIKRSIESVTTSFSIIGTLNCCQETIFKDDAIVHGTTYIYSVHSCDRTGESIAQNCAKITCPRSPPPSNVKAKTSTLIGGTIIVSWSAVPNCSGYKIYRSSLVANIDNSSKCLLATIIDSTVDSFTDSNAENGIQFKYTVACVDFLGISADSNDAIGQSALPGPTDLCAKILRSKNTIVLSWTGIQGATGYRIKRKNQHGQLTIIEQLKNESLNEFFDKEIVRANSPYIYTVCAIDNTSESLSSNSVSVKLKSSISDIKNYLIEVRSGNLLTEQVDAIIISSTSDYLVRNVLKASGLMLNDYNKNDCVVPTLGRLPCTYIIFPSLDTYYAENPSLEVSIRKFIKETINLAIKAKCNTIAFPAIGCGGHGCAVETVAATMISEASAQMQLDETGRIHISIIIESDKADIFNVFSKHAKDEEDRLKRTFSSDESILNWDIIDDKYPLRVNLSKLSKEYGDVLRGFQDTMGIQARIRIERIQNERLYVQYQAEREHFHEKLNKNTERILYHGCPNDDKRLTSIIENGFDRSRAGQQTGTVFGHGTYFSSKASESHGYTQADYRTGERVMFACLVLLGESTSGNSSTKICPEGYHSTTNGTSIFVVYRDCQTYPNYLIFYGGKS